MKIRILKLFLSILFLASSISINAQGELKAKKAFKKSEKYKPHVVRIKNKDEGGINLGFGFIIRENKSHFYILTVDHILSDAGFNKNDHTFILYYNSTKWVAAEIIEMNPDEDLAVLKAPKYFNHEWKYKILARKIKRYDKVWFIGKESDWHVPTHLGTVNTVTDTRIKVDLVGAQPGTSGAPLLNFKGVIGIVDKDGDNINAIPMKHARSIYQPWIQTHDQINLGYPAITVNLFGSFNEYSKKNIGYKFFDSNYRKALIDWKDKADLKTFQTSWGINADVDILRLSKDPDNKIGPGVLGVRFDWRRSYLRSKTLTVDGTALTFRNTFDTYIGYAKLGIEGQSEGLFKAYLLLGYGKVFHDPEIKSDDGQFEDFNTVFPVNIKNKSDVYAVGFGMGVVSLNRINFGLDFTWNYTRAKYLDYSVKQSLSDDSKHDRYFVWGIHMGYSLRKLKTIEVAY